MKNAICTDCRIPMDAAAAVIDLVDGERTALCTPCAEDRGWYVPAPRRPLADRVDAIAEQAAANVKKAS